MIVEHIVYITSHSFKENDKQRYGMDYFIQINKVVEIIDISKLVYPKLNSNIVQLENIDIILIKNISMLVEYLKGINKNHTIFFNFAGESNCHILKVLECLDKSTMIFGTVNFGLSSSIKRNFLEKIINASFNQIINKIKLRICSNFYSFSYPIFISTSSMPNTKYHTKNNIHIHTFDYDLYLNSIENKINNISEDYAVFLDINLMFHPDIKLLGIKFGIKLDADSYYKNLNKLFLNIEEKYKIKIHFALHPTFDMKNIKYLYGREYHINDTVNIVKNAKFCLTHGSTSVNFAVLFKKPILYILTQEIKAQSSLNSFLFKSSHELGSDVIDIDSFKENDKYNVKSINESFYNDFKLKYIKNNLSTCYTWQYILEQTESKF